MREKELDNLLNIFFEIINREEEVDRAFTTYMKVVAPDSYAPILEDNLISTFIKGVEMFDRQIADILNYYVWDCNRNGVIKFGDGKEYILKTKEDLFNYITKEILGKQ